MSKYYYEEDIRDVIRKIETEDLPVGLGVNPRTWCVALLKELPAIDIVKCKDCAHKYVTGDTTQYYVCDFMDAQFDENGYCHHGER